MEKNAFCKIFLFFYLLLVILSACSINKMAVKAVTGSLAEGGEDVFARDEDPLLVRDAMPLLLKLNELLAEKDPGNHELLVMTGKMFIIYSNLFIHTPADMLDYREWKKQAEMYSRSKKMYMRGSRYLRESIEIKHKKHIDLSDSKTLDIKFSKDDVDALFWLGGGIMSAVSIDITDPFLSSLRQSGIDIMLKAYELDPDYGKGALHEYFIQYYASIPAGMGGSTEKSQYHFKRALELSEGGRLSPYIAYASSVAVKNQSAEGVAEFRELIKIALEIDVESYPENRLQNLVTRDKALWMLENIDNYFLVD